MFTVSEVTVTAPPQTQASVRRMYLVSIASTLVVFLAAPFDVPHTARAAWRREWISLWTDKPQVAPDLLHGRAFAAWLRVAYPLIAVSAVGMWLIDRWRPGVVTPVPFFAIVFFAVVSGAVHLVRNMMNIPNVSLASQVVAGWPLELVIAAVSTALAIAIFGH